MDDDLMQRLGERVKALAGSWPNYAPPWGGSCCTCWVT